ncbi:MAG: hypothetical protein ACP5FH_09435, partial [Terracidiphilus sp.]
MNSVPVVRIRRMAPEDLDRVMEIAAGLEQAPRWSPAAYRAVFDPAVVPPRIALVAEDPGGGFSPPAGRCARVAAVAIASLMPPEAELEIVAVAAAQQRRGLARR